MGEFTLMKKRKPKRRPGSGADAAPTGVQVYLSQNVSIRWFLSSQFTLKPVNLILLFLIMRLS